MLYLLKRNNSILYWLSCRWNVVKKTEPNKFKQFNSRETKTKINNSEQCENKKQSGYIHYNRTTSNKIKQQVIKSDHNQFNRTTYNKIEPRIIKSDHKQ